MKFENIINLTPHSLNIVTTDGNIVDLPSSGVARVASNKVMIGSVNGVGLYQEQYGDVEGLPSKYEDLNAFYVVSRLVANAVPDREDLLVPGELIRNDEGQVIGCRGLVVAYSGRC